MYFHKKMKTYVHKKDDLYKIFISAISIITKTWKHPTGEQVNKCGIFI